MDDDVYTEHIQEEYKLIFDALQSKIVECWTRISTNWSKELFMNQLDRWDKIQKCIFSRVSTIHDIPFHLLDKTCKTCRTIWNNKELLHRQCIKLENIYNLEFIDYISITDVCPNCDSFINPFLSNPINEEYVKRYIHKSFHKYILLSSHKSYEIGYYKGKINGISKAISEFNISFEYHFEENDSGLEEYSYSDGYKQGFDEHYRKTYSIYSLFVNELKERIKKNNFDDIVIDYTDYYMIENLEETKYYSSEDDDEWLMVE